MGFIKFKFIAMSAHRHDRRDIAPRVFVWGEGVLLTAAAALTTILALDIIMDLAEGWNFYNKTKTKTKEIICSTPLITLMLVHALLFLFYVCSRLSRQGHKTTSSQPVVATSKAERNIEAEVDIVPLQTVQPVFPPPPETPSPIPTPTPTSMSLTDPEPIQGIPHDVLPTKVEKHSAMP